MKLVEEIIGLLTEQGKITEALTKGQLLAHKLGDPDLRAWVLSELNGYRDPDSVPSYRHFRGELMGTAANQAYRLAHTTIPVEVIPEELRDEFLTVKVPHGISAVESLIGEKATGLPVPSDVCAAMSKLLGGGYQIQSAYIRLPAGTYEEILANVRTRYLDLMLALSERLPAEPEPEAIKAVGKEVDVKKFISNATFGDNVTINFGDGNTFSHNNIVSKGDFQSLANELKTNKVSAPDISILETAIAQDEQSEEVAQGQLGPKVRGWIGGMVAKAGTAAWDFSIQAGAGVLASAISKYYGIS